ncbi:MAG: hypothetical protein JWN70_5594, partial [Planctomycetaceae bacterium]|nr:hypothetical protein [Planctomycetaceae bacterium]
MHERDLFISALEFKDPALRRAHLDAACGSDLVLRARMEQLLSCPPDAGNFLERPAAELCSNIVPELLVDGNESARGPGILPALPCDSNETEQTALVNPVVSAESGPKPGDAGRKRNGLAEQESAVGTLFGRYQVEHVLGTGGMGVVYLVKDLRLGRRVALKIPRFDVDGRFRLGDRFRREARIMASVLHRNLCPIFDVDEQDGQHYLTMAFIDGTPLSQAIKEGQSFTARQIAELIRKLALALDAAHRAGVVHRDLKPANVMLDHSGEPILMDFGLAWLAHEADARVTQPGAIIGTPAYMAPEQADREYERVGAPSDIYSLGAIFYELLTGRPIRTGNMSRVLYELMHDDPVRPSKIRSDIDPELEAICCKAISRRPEDRFATAAEFAEAIASFLDRSQVDQRSVKSEGFAGLSTESPRVAENGLTEALSQQGRVVIGESTAVLSQDQGTMKSLPHQVSRWSKSRIVLACLSVIGLLGGAWATLGPKREVETPKPAVTVAVSPARPAVQPTIQPEIQLTKPARPVDSGKPFAIIHDGQERRTFKTLAGAMDERQPGEIVEIRSNDLLRIRWVERITKPLAIRAGVGYRPRLSFVGQGEIIRIEGDFSVEGCDLDFRAFRIPSPSRTATWRFHRCRLWGDLPGSVYKIRVSDSVYISIYGVDVPTEGTSSDYEFDNCLIRLSHIMIRYGGSGSHTLRFRNCTVYAVAGGNPYLAHVKEEAKLTVEATGNVFHCQSQATELIAPQSRTRVTWIGAGNCFSGSWYQIWEGGVLKVKGLSAWNKLWKEPERDSREVDFLAFEWGRIQRLTNPGRFLAVRAATEKMIAQHKLPEVGPDWNLVGPGAAYVRALAAEGRAVPESELRPERREDGPIVLLRAGKEVGGYLTLKAAVDAAQDKDVIELRTDGLLKDCRWTGDSRLLTIRAGAGYTPSIDPDLESIGTDRLILEGLTIRHVLHASGGWLVKDFGDDKTPLYPSRGSLLRMMNCTGLSDTANCIVDAWMIGDGKTIPEIVNCNFGLVRIGLQSGATARLRNSVFGECRPNIESRAEPPGKLEIERCVFWLPEPAINVWTSSLVSLSPIAVQSQRSIFVAPIDLTFGHPRLIDWTGNGNVFVKAHAFFYGKEPFQLEQLQTETDSIELPPWEFDPAQWRILRDKSTGYQPRPDGTDYGADIDGLVKDIGTNADRQAKSPPGIAATGWHGWPADAPRPAIAPFDAQQARVHQQAWAKQLGVPAEYAGPVGIKLVLIPPGEFTMGSNPADVTEALRFVGQSKEWQEYVQSEGPQHKVILTQPFFLGVYEVSQAEYEKVMGRDRNLSWFAPLGTGKDHVAGMDVTKHPVEMASWNDAAEFCARLSQFEKLSPCYVRDGETVTPLPGSGYRLPTEAQWEFACRAGAESRYWFGDKYEDLPQADWFDLNAGARTQAVGELKANPFGLHDLHGNVWEWAQDWWGPAYYGTLPEKGAIDPLGPPSAGLQRV